ncbi:MAG: lytic transglycosylase domain-containing protein, partial [Chromatiaceae bacterium]|nr:lytic transglycosylase domain-containing protein [Chromatiaceae bacterium]
ACGLMQLMPATAQRFAVRDVWDPAQNIEGGVAFLRVLIDRFEGDLKLVLAAYNAGEGAVAKYGNRIPPYRETQQYVRRVLGYLGRGSLG